MGLWIKFEGGRWPRLVLLNPDTGASFELYEDPDHNKGTAKIKYYMPNGDPILVASGKKEAVLLIFEEIEKVLKWNGHTVRRLSTPDEVSSVTLKEDLGRA